MCILFKGFITSHDMFSTLIDFSPVSPSLSTPNSSSPLFTFRWPTTSAPQTGLLFGQMDEQSPLTCHEPKAPVEVSSTGRAALDRLATTSLQLLLRRRQARDRNAVLATISTTVMLKEHVDMCRRLQRRCVAPPIRH